MMEMRPFSVHGPMVKFKGGAARGGGGVVVLCMSGGKADLLTF
jgi:hypothetical protein